MVDLKNLKKVNRKKKGLGAPPKAKEVKNNLEQPEVIETVVVEVEKTPTKNKTVGRPKTKRTAQLTLKLEPEFKEKLKLLSFTSKQPLGEIIQTAVEFWEENKK